MNKKIIIKYLVGSLAVIIALAGRELFIPNNNISHFLYLIISTIAFSCILWVASN